MNKKFKYTVLGIYLFLVLVYAILLGMVFAAAM